MNRMYFIAHVLPEELNRQVLKLKMRMKERFGCLVGLNSPAHITLIPPFWMKEDMDMALKIVLDEMASGVKPFKLLTNGFNSFKPGTIFIEPILTPELEKLKTIADEFMLRHPEFGARTDERKYHPHITIATRDLQRKDFSEAWSLFQGKGFEVEWQAENISLLSHNKKNWDVVHTSQFQKFI